MFNPRDFIDQATTPKAPAPAPATAPAETEAPVADPPAAPAVEPQPADPAPVADPATDVDDEVAVDIDPVETDDSLLAEYDQELSADAARDAQPNYFMRKLMWFGVLPAALIVAAWFLIAGPFALKESPATLQHHAAAPEQSKDPSRALTQDATLDIATLAAGDQRKATTALKKTGTLDGFTIKASGVRTAAAGTSAVISRTHAGVCYMYGVLGGNPTAVQTDATGAACTDAEIASAQRALDEQTLAAEQADAEAAQAAFTSASDTVVYFAGKSFDAAGVPTLTGIPADLGAGVRVVANHGDYVTAQTTINGACKQAELSADGTLGQIIPCP